MVHMQHSHSHSIDSDRVNNASPVFPLTIDQSRLVPNCIRKPSQHADLCIAAETLEEHMAWLWMERVLEAWTISAPSTQKCTTNLELNQSFPSSRSQGGRIILLK